MDGMTPKKEEREPVTKVISGQAKRKKKSEIRRFKDSLISENVGQVKNHVIEHVMIPAIKTLICDMVTDGIRMIFLGEKGSDKGRGGSARYISYDTFGYNRDYDRGSYRRSTGYDFDDIWLDTYDEALAILDRMKETIRRYGVVRVADMYEMAGFPSDYTDNRYGWASLNTAEIVRGHNGYGFRLPKVSPIE